MDIVDGKIPLFIDCMIYDARWNVAKKVTGQVGLGVKINKKHLLSFRGENGAYSRHRRCFSYATFMVGYGYDFSFHVVFSFL